MVRITKAELLEAVNNSGGIMSIIAQKLNCSWETAKKNCNKYKAVQEAIASEKEKTKDKAETVIIKSIQEMDVQTAKWYLTLMARDRGYVNNVDVTSGGEVLPPAQIFINGVYPEDNKI